MQIDLKRAHKPEVEGSSPSLDTTTKALQYDVYDTLLTS